MRNGGQYHEEIMIKHQNSRNFNSVTYKTKQFTVLNHSLAYVYSGRI